MVSLRGAADGLLTGKKKYPERDLGAALLVYGSGDGGGGPGEIHLEVTSREQNLRGASDVQSYFQRMGLSMWRSRAEQIHAAAGRFSKEKLEEGIGLVFRADRDMKGSRPDDRIVMEDFVFRLTG